MRRRVKRRAFLTSGVAIAGGSSLAAFARSGSAQGVTPSATRIWACPPNRYEISLWGPSLTVDCFSLDAPSGGHANANETAREAMVTVGPQRQPVSWEVAAWHQPDPFTQMLVLQAADYPLRAEIRFAFDQQSGLLTRDTLLRHHGDDGEIDIRATLGFSFTIHEPIKRIIYLSGGWTEEADIQRARPGDAAIVLESRAGKTGFEFQPYVALRAGAATYLCQILWSGNWMLRVAPNRDGATLLGGLNNWNFRHRLRPGGTLALPTVLFARFEGLPDLAARRLHDHRRAHRPDPDRAIPVQYNSWYPHQGEPNAEALLPLVPLVKKLGCEAFVVDAGWYRTDEGESDAEWDQRTGDWRVSRRRFPSGLREVAARCHREGLLLGLWFEPEVIAPSSSIRRDHPDWLHHIDGRLPPVDERAVLHLGVPAAWQHVFDRVTRILRGAGVDWMKWDFNADIGPGGWAPTLPEELVGQAPLVAHYHGLYRLQDAIRAAFPNLILEMCASGGGRLDGAILSHAHVNWMSDQIGALRKLAIHFGMHLAHPAVVCNDWLIDWPGSSADDKQAPLVDSRGDLPFRLRVAMLGSFGISAPVERWSDADMRTVAAHIAQYTTRLRPIIHHGDQYVLTKPPPTDGNGDWAAIWYVAKDGSAGALFAFRLASLDTGCVFRLSGLREERRYRVSFFSGEAAEISGQALAAGFTITIADPYRSELCWVEALPA